MNELIEHYSKMAFVYAEYVAKRRKAIKDKKYGKQYQQEDWERSLKDEDMVIFYAEKLMDRLEQLHDNQIMKKLINNGDIK